MDREIVEMVRFLDPEIVEMVDRSYINVRQPSMEDVLQWKTTFNGYDRKWKMTPSTPNLMEINNQSAMLDSPAPPKKAITLFTMGGRNAA